MKFVGLVQNEKFMFDFGPHLAILSSYYLTILLAPLVTPCSALGDTGGTIEDARDQSWIVCV